MEGDIVLDGTQILIAVIRQGLGPGDRRLEVDCGAQVLTYCRTRLALCLGV